MTLSDDERITWYDLSEKVIIHGLRRSHWHRFPEGVPPVSPYGLVCMNPLQPLEHMLVLRVPFQGVVKIIRQPVGMA